MHTVDGEAVFFLLFHCFHLNPHRAPSARCAIVYHTHVFLMLIRRIRPNFDYLYAAKCISHNLITPLICSLNFHVRKSLLLLPFFLNPNECRKKTYQFQLRYMRAYRFILHCLCSHFCSTLSLCGLRNCDLQCH